MKTLHHWSTQLLSLLLAAAIVCSFLPAQAAAADGDVILEAEDCSPVFTGSWVEKNPSKGVGMPGHGTFVIGQAAEFSGQTVTFTLAVPEEGTYTLYCTEKDNPDRGIFQTLINGQPLGEVDFYFNGQSHFEEHALGTAALTKGNNTLTFKLTGKSNNQTPYGIVLDFFRLVPAQAPVQPKLLYSELFDTMPETLSGGAWQLQKMQNGSALQGSVAPYGMLGTLYEGKTLQAPFTIVADLLELKANGGGGNSFGLVFGMTSNKDFYHYRIDNAYGEAQLFRWNGGASKLNGLNLDTATGVPYRLRVTYDGTTLHCYTNGRETAEKALEIPTGTVGLRLYNDQVLVDNYQIYDAVVPPVNGQDQPDAFQPNTQAVILNNEDEGYKELSGTWTDLADAGHNGSKARTSQGGAAEFSLYTPQTGRFEVLYYVTDTTADAIETVITTVDGLWKAQIPAGTSKGWHRLKTVAGTEGTAFTVQASSQGTLICDAIKLVKTTAQADETWTPVSGGSDEVAILVNQIGYDSDSSKRATIPNVADGEHFRVINLKTGETAFEGEVRKNIADFTALQTTEDTDFRIDCAGKNSYDFTIGENLIYRRSVKNALDFMNETRADAFCRGGSRNTGVGWRDSHQFSFELNTLVMQYMANPSLYDNLPYGIVHADTCDYAELRNQDEPDMIWLMEFAALRIYDMGKLQNQHLHMLTKEQMAYFLYIYPAISEYVSQETYEKLRDYIISVWGDSQVSAACQWHAVPNTNHDLYSVQEKFGGLKGSQPLGHSIVPNLMMYEVCKRDGLEGADRFFQAAYDNCAYTITKKDINDPFYAKGQRMSEHVTMTALTYFLEMYPEKAPAGLKEAIAKWASVNVLRADNLWDMRMAVSEKAGDLEYQFHNPSLSGQKLPQEYWTGAAYANADKQKDYLVGGAPKNEPGNQAGLQAITYAAARVLEDPAVNTRLKAIGVAAIDDLYGRNPSGRAAFYHFTRDFEGGELGWYKQLGDGYGMLGGCTGVIEANTPEGCYPYNPAAYNTGYTEGWVAYNTAWNASLAYSSADSIVLTADKTSGKIGDEITISLQTPNNLDSAKQEQAEVVVTNLTTGTAQKLTLTEQGTATGLMQGTLQLPDAAAVRISYGSSLFEQAVEITVTDFVRTPLTSVVLTPASLTLVAGEIASVEAEVLPADANDRTLTWTSDNEAVATVENGVVTAVGEGKATITAAGWDGTKGTIPVTVQPVLPTEILLEGPTELQPKKSASILMKGIRYSDNHVMTQDLPTITFTVDQPDLASITAAGVLTGIRSGKVLVTASAVVDGVTVTGQLTVTIAANYQFDLLQLYRDNAYETKGVTMKVATPTHDDLTDSYGLDRIKLQGVKKDNQVDFHLGALEAGTYDVTLYTKYYGGTWAYGQWRFCVNGQPVGDPIDFDNESKNGYYFDVALGEVEITAPETSFSFVSVDGGSLVPVSVKLRQKAAAHTHKGTLVPGTDATCTTEGVKDYYSCTCGKVFEDEACKKEIEDLETWKVLAKLPHNPEAHAKVEPTCEQAGTKAYWSCKTCGKVFEDESCTREITDLDSWKEIPATGHTWGDWIVISEADYHKEGLEKHICQVCGAEETRVIQALPPESEHVDGNPVAPTEPGKPEALLPFTDVAEDQWYFDDVKQAFEAKLIDGMDASHFNPNGTLTVAQTIKLAAALHERDKTGRVTLENGKEAWFSTYVDYAVHNDVIDESYQALDGVQMNKAITRSEFVKIFHGAMSHYGVKNDVADNAIPDVKMNTKNAAEIYDFYRAGILIGSDEAGTFYPESQIKRSEAAAILIRMFDLNARQTITLK